MATLSVTKVPVDGGLTVATDPATSTGDEAPVGANRFLYVTLAAAATGTPTVTIATPGTVKGLTIEDVSHTMAAGQVWLLPLTSEFRGSNGRAAITYSAVTDLSVAVFELER